MENGNRICFIYKMQNAAYADNEKVFCSL